MPKLHKSEGDINISPRRDAWQKKHLDSGSRALLAEDARYFLRQSLSTPCLNTMATCGGIFIEDTQGRRYMDFHGNNVHQVGFANPAVIDAIKRQLNDLSFCTRRYTNRVAVDLAKKLAEIAPDPLKKSLFCPGGGGGHRHRAEAGAHRHRPAQNCFHVGCLPRRHPRHDLGRRRGDVPPGHGPLMPGTEHVPPRGRVSLHLRLRRPRGLRHDLRPLRGIRSGEGGRRRRGHRRADALHAHHPPRPSTGRVFAGLRPPRGAADLRRDPHCAGPHRTHVHLRKFRRRAGHGGHRQRAGRRVFYRWPP